MLQGHYTNSAPMATIVNQPLFSIDHDYCVCVPVVSKGSSGNTWSSSSTSSSTVSSSSAGLQKIRSTSSLGASVEEAGVKEEGGGEGEEEGEGETQPLDQSTSPFAKDSQSPE